MSEGSNKLSELLTRNHQATRAFIVGAVRTLEHEIEELNATLAKSQARVMELEREAARRDEWQQTSDAYETRDAAVARAHKLEARLVEVLAELEALKLKEHYDMAVASGRVAMSSSDNLTLQVLQKRLDARERMIGELKAVIERMGVARVAKDGEDAQRNINLEASE